ncbi:hypothetical protein SAMN05216207_10865 [Pseudonocardia ammonioxydans]|uniref:Uncharacterized protein n=2 Tax=Pseudonocardia ammonioxydans TaxID=260086 RepID=A0A1I5I436_PSUAM|nr:hypothetical protein SAMN05216207_10865 [Pseudonocardia ammonioxydans]
MCGMLGVLLVAGAVVVAAAPPLTVAGLALASAGVVLSGGGLALGMAAAFQRRPRANRAAISAAALSVVGLAGGLTWLSALVITVVTGSAPMAPAEVASSPACLSAASGDTDVGQSSRH